MTNELDSFIEGHLDLQVRISYSDHHAFLLRHNLENCSRILDVGTGNGFFVSRLAHDHPSIQFVGIDKRHPCIDSAQKYVSTNLNFTQLDMFARESGFNFSMFDGFLMRYFLLHVDHAKKILDLLKQKSKRPARFWIIDLDWSQFECVPAHPTFEKLTQLVKSFCSKISVHSQGGQNVVPLLHELGFEEIVVEHLPFSTKTIPRDDLALYIRQEVLCYSMMSGKGRDADTEEILRFIEEDFKFGKVEIRYGMTLVSAMITGEVVSSSHR